MTCDAWVHVEHILFGVGIFALLWGIGYLLYKGGCP